MRKNVTTTIIIIIIITITNMIPKNLMMVKMKLLKSHLRSIVKMAKKRSWVMKVLWRVFRKNVTTTIISSMVLKNLMKMKKGRYLSPHIKNTSTITTTMRQRKILAITMTVTLTISSIRITTKINLIPEKSLVAMSQTSMIIKNITIITTTTTNKM